MFTYLIELIECPVCHNKLRWNIKEEYGRHIIEASIECVSCNSQYYVKNGIGNFLLSNETNDNWKKGDDYITSFFSEHPEIEEKLMNTPIDSMNAADLSIRAELLERQGKTEEAKIISKKASLITYTPEYMHGMETQFNYLLEYLKSHTEPVVDIASGRCGLVARMLEKTNRDIIATDYSFTVLKKDKNDLTEQGYDDRVSFLAFDAKQTPFKEGSLKTLTTFVGLQNIENPGNLLSELRRITSGEFLSISLFCPEDDAPNASVLRKFGLNTTWFRTQSEAVYKSSGWEVTIKNSYYAKTLPTPRGEIVSWYAIDGIPVAETTFEWCVVRAI